MKIKIAECKDCTDGKEKPLTAGRCCFHYKKHRAEVNAFKAEKRAEMNDFLGKTETKKKTKPIPKVSAKQIERLAKYRKVRDEFMKLHPTCQARLQGCTIKATDCHHSKGKVGDLLTDKRYFKALCRSCHNFLEVHPKTAKEIGFSLSRLEKITH